MIVNYHDSPFHCILVGAGNDWARFLVFRYGHRCGVHGLGCFELPLIAERSPQTSLHVRIFLTHFCVIHVMYEPYITVYSNKHSLSLSHSLSHFLFAYSSNYVCFCLGAAVTSTCVHRSVPNSYLMEIEWYV